MRGYDGLKSQDLKIMWAFFCVFWGKTIPLKQSLLHGSRRKKSARTSPHIWLTLSQILSKSVHFRRSYCERVKTVFATYSIYSNQIKFICYKFSTQYNNEFALHLAGQTGDNFALMSAHYIIGSSSLYQAWRQQPTWKQSAVWCSSRRNYAMFAEHAQSVHTTWRRAEEVDWLTDG